MKLILAQDKPLEIQLGAVDFKVHSITNKENEQGDTVLNVKLVGIDSEGVKQTIYENFVNNEAAVWKIYQFGESLGLGEQFESREIDTNELIDMVGRAVIDRKHCDEDSRYTYRYFVKKFLPLVVNGDEHA